MKRTKSQRVQSKQIREQQRGKSSSVMWARSRVKSRMLDQPGESPWSEVVEQQAPAAPKTGSSELAASSE